MFFARCDRFKYPGYSLISDRDSARECFLMIWDFFKRPVSHDSLVGYMLTLLFTSVSVKAQDIHRAAFGKYPGLFASTSVNYYSIFTF